MTVVGLTRTRCVRKPRTGVCGNGGGAWNPSTFFASDMLGVGQTARDRFTPERRDFRTRFDAVPTRDESCQQETTSVCVRAQEQGVCGHTYRIASSANAPPTCAHCCNQPHQSPRSNLVARNTAERTHEEALVCLRAYTAPPRCGSPQSLPPSPPRSDAREYAVSQNKKTVIFSANTLVGLDAGFNGYNGKTKPTTYIPLYIH